VNTKFNYNSILCAPTICYTDNKGLSPALNLNGITGLMLNKKHREIKGLNKEDVGNPLEFYVRNMLCACASTISIPAYGKSMWASPRQIKSGLSDSASKRLKFVDRSHAVWEAVESYLKPIDDDIRKSLTKEEIERGGSTQLEKIAWDLYLLLLAVRGHSEVTITPSRTLSDIDGLNRRFALRAENRTRLAIVRGIFALYNKASDIPGFRCISNRGQSLKERLDEILDDAYLLDASRLRRFFGLQSNTRAIKRDLRKLTAFIAKNRPWAKGAIMAASQSATLANSSAEVMDKVIDLFPELTSDSSVPILIDSDSSFTDMGKLMVVSSQRRPFQPSENWMVTIRLNKPPFTAIWNKS
jgi:hypothetical protein